MSRSEPKETVVLFANRCGCGGAPVERRYRLVLETLARVSAERDALLAALATDEREEECTPGTRRVARRTSACPSEMAEQLGAAVAQAEASEADATALRDELHRVRCVAGRLWPKARSDGKHHRRCPSVVADHSDGILGGGNE